ncbi:YjfI family protein [Pseudomonas solani]|nr:YjfI family protein [Pseudomonas solani]MDN4145738.1 YjfI family protein [Pseudomonas tohonis]
MPRKTTTDKAGKKTTGSTGKSSADYVRDMRNRLREAGLVKREFWILPENVNALKGIERALRQPFLGGRVKLEDYMTENSNWTLSSLHNALAELALVASGEILLSVIDGEQAGLRLTMSEYGDLPIYLAVEGDHIMVDATLVPLDLVKDANEFNALVLRTRDLFPLSSVGVEVIDGQEVYSMFGALSAASSLTVIVQEIYTLAENVIRAVEAFEDHFKA